MSVALIVEETNNSKPNWSVTCLGASVDLFTPNWVFVLTTLILCKHLDIFMLTFNFI